MAANFIDALSNIIIRSSEGRSAEELEIAVFGIIAPTREKLKASHVELLNAFVESYYPNKYVVVDMVGREFITADLAEFRWPVLRKFPTWQTIALTRIAPFTWEHIETAREIKYVCEIMAREAQLGPTNDLQLGQLQTEIGAMKKEMARLQRELKWASVWDFGLRPVNMNPTKIIEMRRALRDGFAPGLKGRLTAQKFLLFLAQFYIPPLLDESAPISEKFILANPVLGRPEWIVNGHVPRIYDGVDCFSAFDEMRGHPYCALRCAISLAALFELINSGE